MAKWEKWKTVTVHMKLHPTDPTSCTVIVSVEHDAVEKSAALSCDETGVTYQDGGEVAKAHKEHAEIAWAAFKAAL